MVGKRFRVLTSMLPPTLASRGGSGLSLSFLRPFLFGLRELAAEETQMLLRR